MKNSGYRLLKLWVKAGLYLYYGNIKISGLQNVPRNEPVLFLPNHQGALMDVLLIVTDCHRKPFFLTRSDVFERTTLIKFFAFLRMLPIYRIRDGRESLKKNRAIFDQCSQLFGQNHAMVMFPEANHNIKRRVRPLSKGFTRILLNTLKRNPELKIHIIPVGMNYRSNTGFPDKVALNYGMPIVANDYYDEKETQNTIHTLKDVVSDSLKTLTTHIEDEKKYDATLRKLDALQVDYLNPSETNFAIKNWDASDDKKADLQTPAALKAFFKGIFIVLNLPVIILWRTGIKPKVREPEFMGTFRFGFALLVYPIFYLVLFAVIAAIWNGFVGMAVIIGLFLFNWGYVRWN
ncbi:1-acyl-sn-glycerol-3-phosphate acyltransferase [Pricia antarctica]|uniref:1-acyl-sn-glycerol-3-phosphate acyltransferase n=1 Tax=Pricia antarctica TaxID=641691 RepID=A0A1G6ZM51_9FLAO|nr:1-acyl-sn-glycerol-3-phosphate acyltransferase [Pricia antarctica]SDE03728.1 1-acyl-sn-glycerol-3-phosphate acyltransferase [Pricia antarctica]